MLLPLALLSLCRLLPRYGWSFLSDIPAALLVAAGFLIQLPEEKGGHRYLWAGLCFGLAANFKFYLLISVGLGALAWMWVRGGTKKQAAALLLSGLLSALGVHLLTAVFLSGGHLPEWNFWKEIFGGQFLAGAKMGGVRQEAWWAYLPLFAASCGWLAPLLVAVGLPELIRRRSPGDRLLLLWGGGLGIVLLAGGHHEARYLFPILLPLIWCEALGILQVGEWLSGPGRNRFPFVIVVALAVAVWPMALEAVGLSETWLRRPIQQDICDEILSESGGCGEFLFVGPFYPLVLAREVFSPRDDFYSIFHLGASQMIFWEETRASFRVGAPGPKGYWLPTPDLLPAGNGRMLVVSGFRSGVRASSLMWALDHPQAIVLIREEVELLDRGSSPAWSDPKVSTGGVRAPKTEARIRATFLGEDFFARGRDGKFQLAPPSHRESAESSPPRPSYVLRRRYLISGEVIPGK